MECFAFIKRIVFNVAVSFQLTRHFLLVLRTNGCLYSNEIAIVGSRGTEVLSTQASVLFRNVVVRGETSVTYFLNAHCTFKFLSYR